MSSWQINSILVYY